MKCSEVFWCQTLADAAKILNDGISAVAAFAVFLAAIAGTSALKNFQKKRNLKRKMKYAKRTVMVIKRARIALATIRNSFVFPEEEILAKRDLEEISKNNKDFVVDDHRIVGMAYFKRYEKEKRLLDKIRECALVANISLGDEADEVENYLNTIMVGFNEILQSASYLIAVGESDGIMDNVRYFGILKEGFSWDIEKEIFEDVYNSMNKIESEFIEILKPEKS